jgi:beta-phosphoglucomutase
MGLRLATGSPSRNAPELLKRTGLAEFFEETADGNEISRSKPDPEVFLLAAAKLGLDPAACLVVEDAVSGIEAAKAGNFRSLAVGDAASNSLLCDPDAMAHSLKFLIPDDVFDIC